MRLAIADDEVIPEEYSRGHKTIVRNAPYVWEYIVLSGQSKREDSHTDSFWT